MASLKKGGSLKKSPQKAWKGDVSSPLKQFYMETGCLFLAREQGMNHIFFRSQEGTRNKQISILAG
jgi:hypothetical protein